MQGQARRGRRAWRTSKAQGWPGGEEASRQAGRHAERVASYTHQLWEKCVNMSTRTAWERRNARYGMACCCGCCTRGAVPRAWSAAPGRSLRARDPLHFCALPPHAPLSAPVLLLLSPPSAAETTPSLLAQRGRGMRLRLRCLASSGRSLACTSGSLLARSWTIRMNHSDHRVPARAAGGRLDIRAPCAQPCDPSVGRRAGGQAGRPRTAYTARDLLPHSQAGANAEQASWPSPRGPPAQAAYVLHCRGGPLVSTVRMRTRAQRWPRSSPALCALMHASPARGPYLPCQAGRTGWASPQC